VSAERRSSSSPKLRPQIWTAYAVAGRLAALLAAAWIALLLATFGSVLGTIDWNADIASTFTIGEFYPHVPDGATVTLASYPWYATLWFELLTRHLPFHREIWEVAPWLGSVAAVGLLSWTTARVAGWWAAGIVALTLACAGKGLLLIQFGTSQHGTVVWYACLLNSFLMLLVARAGKVGAWSTHVLLAALIAAVVAAGLASDKLVYLAALAPFLAAGLVVSRLAPRATAVRISLTTIAVVVAAVAGSRIAVAEMRARHVVAGPYPVSLTSTTRLVQNALDALQSLFAVFNGAFDRQAVTAASLLALACAVLVAVALVASGRFAFRWTGELARQLLVRGPHGGREALLRTTHLSFWLVAAGLPIAAYVVTTVAGENTGRYLLTTAYGIVVLIVVGIAGTSRTRRTAVTLAACVIVLGSLVSLTRDFDNSSGDEMVREVLPFAEGEGLTYGYGAYWTAVPLTWRSHLRVQVTPVVSCPKAPHGLCAYYNHTISNWYDPRPGVRSFLIVDRRYGPPPPGKRLGGTDEVIDFPHFSIYVYDYDIASNIAPDWWHYIASDVAPPLQ
jgi:hypothetical protein